MSGPKVRIQVRTDIDWQSMDATAFEAQTDRDRPLLFIKFAANSGVFDVWNQVSELDFFRLREQLAAIARANHEAVVGATRTAGLDDFTEWFASGGDEWVVPVDDDDIFAPDLVDQLATVPEAAGVAVWPELVCFWAGNEPHGPYRAGGGREKDVGKPILYPTPQQVLWTNNWAIRKSYLQHHFDAATARQMLTDHRFATQQVAGTVGLSFPPPPDPWYLFDLAGPGIAHLDRPLSMTVKHPASLFFLWNILQTPDPVAEIRMRRFGEPVPIPHELRWAQASLRAIEQLLAQALTPSSATTGH